MQQHPQRLLVLAGLLSAFVACTHGSPSTSAGEGGGEDGGGSSSSTTSHSDGGATSHQDAGSLCKPLTCHTARANCGPVGDGCGGIIQCGTCQAPETCGGGGYASVCGQGSTCYPRTCISAGANCGPVGDGCGGTIDCGTCIEGQVCGEDTPNVCSGTRPATCQGLCNQQVSCQNGATTTISGIVHAPTPSIYGAADPLYGALVYIPNGPVAPFTTGVACEQCGAPASGQPLISATTDPDGRFVLPNAPAGPNIPLVIQLGRWRRQVTIQLVNPCVDNHLPDEMTRMPRNQHEGDIPLMAMVTGDADPLECVLRKIGIDDSEFTAPSGHGRVHIYVNNGADVSAGAPSMNDLVSNQQTLEQYDMVLFACSGTEQDQTSTVQNNLIQYADHGGRVFATHYSYVWLYNDAPFSDTAAWNPDDMNGYNDSLDALVDQSFPRGVAFAKWLQNVGASTTLGQITLEQTRHDFTAVNPPSQRWLYSNNPAQPLHYTFNTPVGAPSAQQCGRVLFSDFHVNSNGSGGGSNFPDECDTVAMTPQEKALEFMIFDLSSCVPPSGKK